jgi:nicotinate dehydrogenase subunit B
VGVACAIYLGTYVTTMAEVAVNKSTGRVEVKRVVCAQDGGVIVNPDGSRQQMEGSMSQLPRFSWLPRIETVLVENPEAPASGCGSCR